MNKKKNKNLAAVILASGLSVRFGGNTPKQYKKINNKTILEHSIESFTKVFNINDLYIVYNKKHEKYILPIKKKYKNMNFVIGGPSRQKSSLIALSVIFKKGMHKKIIIHDSARPFVTNSLIKKISKNLSLKKGVIPVIKINDSVKLIKKEKIIKNVDRKDLFLSQTPQGFLVNELMNAYNKISPTKLSDYTDDAQIFIDAGYRVNIIKGEENNIKITAKNDLERASQMLDNNIIKVGQGIDVHAFTTGRNFKLFGVNIPFNKTIKAHSDGDVGVHALIDAILGTLADGDIGKHFPDNNKKYKNINSLALLERINKKLIKNNGKILHLDNTIVCEKPKINKYTEKMRKVIAQFLNIEIKSVSIKATTTEKLGFIGKNEGIAVFSIATINFVNEK